MDFVAALSVKTDYSWDGRWKPYTFDVRVVDRDPDRGEMVSGMLREGLRQIPQPIRTATNARLYLERQEQQGLTRLDYYDRAGSTVTSGGVSFSARAVMDYIAGRIDRPRFEILADDWMLGILKRALDAGSAITSVRLSRNPEGDDDKLHIEWHEHDPATSPFRAGRVGH